MRALKLRWAAVAALLGCAGRSDIAPFGGGADGSGSGAAGAANATGGFASHPPCASADGVRLCGGSDDCPWLVPPECPGFGCTHAPEVTSFAPSNAGVCWSDLAEPEACVACFDGDVCLQRDAAQLLCVAPTVCEALWDLGATGVCRYADKSRYDHQHLPVPAGACPGGDATAGVVCGGDCPSCLLSGDAFARCVGRSPHHPFGLCVAPFAYHGADAILVCSLDPTGAVVIACDSPYHYCGVFETPPEDAPAAQRYGVCVETGACVAAALHLPGGLRCYDAAGQVVAP